MAAQGTYARVVPDDRVAYVTADGALQVAGLDDMCAREDIGHLHDLCSVLRIDDGGTARHRQDVVRQQGAEGEVRGPPGGGDDDALRRPDAPATARDPRCISVV